jgi:hypothetical protein
MANVNRPKGLSPIQNGDGSQWNQQATLYYVANDASNTYAIGDVVMLAAGADADGVQAVTKWGGAVSVGAQPIGVIVGIRVADPGVSLVGNPLTLEKTYLGTSSGAHYLYVVDDPAVIYELQGDVTAWATTHANNNATVTLTANQATLSQSSPYSSTVATSPATTNTLPFQVLGIVQRPDNGFGSYAALRVRFNIHSQYGAVTGRTGV